MISASERQSREREEAIAREEYTRISAEVTSSGEAAFGEQLHDVLRRQGEIEARMERLSLRHEQLTAEDRRIHARAGDIQHLRTVLERLRHEHPTLAPLMGASE